MNGERVDVILQAIRRRGGRVTVARRAVVTALLANDDHPTAEDLAAVVQQQHPEVHQSTVYRTLDELRRLGVVTHVHLRHGPSVYHLNEQAHHHLVCDECGAVIEVPMRVLAKLRERIDRDYGFSINSAHFALTGVCADCREDR